MAHTCKTREEWLTKGIDRLRKIVSDAGYVEPGSIRVSVGWPWPHAKKAVACVWSRDCSADGTSEIFVSPILDDPVYILACLAHEIGHVLHPKVVHKGEFKTYHKVIGLVGKVTQSQAGPELTEKLTLIADKLGPYPHAVLTPSEKEKKQTTRMLKLQCEQCGCIIRTTRQWIDEYSEVVWPCPCGGKMNPEV